MPDAAKAKIEQVAKKYRERVDRYESDPATGEGKKELLAKAKALEAKRDHAAEQDPNFDYAEALFQIAIVLGSVSIVAASRPLVNLSGVLTIVGYLADDQRVFSPRASAARVMAEAFSLCCSRCTRSRSES